eukprot:7251316-Lingulodinium_polyedra.AAC.1
MRARSEPAALDAAVALTCAGALAAPVAFSATRAAFAAAVAWLAPSGTHRSCGCRGGCPNRL